MGTTNLPTGHVQVSNSWIFDVREPKTQPSGHSSGLMHRLVAQLLLLRTTITTPFPKHLPQHSSSSKPQTVLLLYSLPHQYHEPLPSGRNVRFENVKDCENSLFRASLVAQRVKNRPVMRIDLGLIPELGRSPGEGEGYPLQYSGLENSTFWLAPCKSCKINLVR